MPEAPPRHASQLIKHPSIGPPLAITIHPRRRRRSPRRRSRPRRHVYNCRVANPMRLANDGRGLSVYHTFGTSLRLVRLMLIHHLIRLILPPHLAHWVPQIPI